IISFSLLLFDVCHKSCAIIIHAVILIIATKLIKIILSILNEFDKFHIVEKTIPNAPVVKATATTLLKLLIILSGLFKMVIVANRLKKLLSFNKNLSCGLLSFLTLMLDSFVVLLLYILTSFSFSFI